LFIRYATPATVAATSRTISTPMNSPPVIPPPAPLVSHGALSPPKRSSPFSRQAWVARGIILGVGVLLPYLAQLPAIRSNGWAALAPWTARGWAGALDIGQVNAFVWGPILLASMSFGRKRSLILAAVLSFIVPALFYSIMNPASPKAPIAMMINIVVSLVFTGGWWIVAKQLENAA